MKLELFTDPQIILNFLTFLEKIYLNATKVIIRFTFQAISTLILLNKEDMFLINPPIVAKT